MRKASLNLSVNAIIIFVLAFAMLGVGLLVTNQLEGLGLSGIDRARELIKNIDEDPSAAKPLVGISKELTIPARKELPQALKYYNKDPSTILDPSVNITECKDTSTGLLMMNPVMIVSLSEDIEPSSFQSIPITIKNKPTSEGGLTGGQTYICKMEIMGKDNLGALKTWYTHVFHLTVES